MALSFDRIYDYGYRDYSPTLARFTTVDPIRDGTNWFAYVNNDPVNWIDPDGEIPVLVGAAIGFVSSSITEVGSRMISGQSFTEAVYDVAHDKSAMANIFVSTVSGALTSGLSSTVLNSVTNSIKAIAGIGVNTISKTATAAVIINTASGAVDAGLKDVVLRVYNNEPQDIMDTAAKMVIGARYAFAGNSISQALTIAGTNISTYSYNGIERSVPRLPEWSAVAGVVGENIIPAVVDIGATLIGRNRKGK
jgi:hypothetical protein